MYLTEKDLKDNFWKKYNYNNRALKFQFEFIQSGRSLDLITGEKLGESYQLNAFEFKLTDIKKAIAQAKFNQEYFQKSWLVFPVDRKEVIENKYLSEIKSSGLGLIFVSDDGTFDLYLIARNDKPRAISNEIIGWLLNGY
ncbi:MAG: hypothetical protein PHI41_08625 [Erysipelotrichaceae bacterium]|nr:hypothetical protein [Erysipelotrichaceae bacterium]